MAISESRHDQQHTEQVKGVNAVTKLNAHLSTITCPAELADLPAWLMWRLEYHEGEKPRKVPYYINGQRRAGLQGSAADRQSLATFTAARAAAARRGFDGVGLALMPDWGLVALDFDNCIANGRLHPEVEAIAATSYAEYSPSGKGVRVLLRGALPNRKSFDAPFGFETFSSKGFVTITGNRLEITDTFGNENTIAPMPPEALALVEQRFPRRESNPTRHDDPVLGLTQAQIERALAAMDPDMGHDDWLHVGMALHHETRGDGFEHWCEWSERGGKFPGRDILQHRWDSFGKGTGPVVTGKTLVKLANAAGAGLSTTQPADPDEFKVMVDTQVAEAKGKPPRFEFQPVHLFARAKAGEWLVKGVLPKAGLAVMYGASGSGKSFMALDMAMAIAQGAEWRGRKVRQGRVAYIAAEGSDGFRKRTAAYGQHTGVDLSSVPVDVLDGAPNLMLLDDAKDLAVGVLVAGGADVIVVDTLAQTTPGANENAGEDMGKALGHCKRLHEMTGALVLLIHHSGKDQAKGARGWSGLRAACDAELEVVRREDGQRSLRLSKNKDGEDGLEWGFALEVVQLGVDEDLDPITSCVVIEAEITKVTMGRVLGPNEEAVNKAIQAMAGVQTTGIEVAAVIREAVKLLPEPADGGRDTRKQRVRRAIEKLCNDDNSPYWLGDDGCISIV